MDIYNYHPDTSEYVSTEEADMDPLDNIPMIPAHATTVVVITPATGNVAVFDGTTWNDVEDHRGPVYDVNTRKQQELDHVDLGPLPSGLTSLVPGDFDSWTGSAWVEDLDLVRMDQKSIINLSHMDALSTGYVTTFTIKMDARYEDVIRLDGGVRLAESLSQTNLSIRDFDNVVHIEETTNVKTMVDEVGVHYQTVLNQKWTYDDQIDQATTKTDIQAVVWV